MTAETLLSAELHDAGGVRACVALQKEVWGFSDAELVPLRIFSLAPKIGGQVVGAWQGDTLVGYAMAIPGSRNGHAYLHSHMVAVKEGHRNSGLGRTIKLFQREDAIANGYELMEWTFDPLEIKNAYFNLERLGAIARRYNVNQYGITNSPLQGLLPTDRLVAEWWMKSRRVAAVLSSRLLSTDHVEGRSKCRPKFTNGSPTLRCARKHSRRRSETAICSRRRFPAGFRVSATSATPMETAAFNSVAGTKTGRMPQIRSQRRDT